MLIGDLVQCPTCDGTGEVHSHNPRCWTCRGRGMVTPEKAREAAASEARMELAFTSGKRVDTLTNQCIDFVDKLIRQSGEGKVKWNKIHCPERLAAVILGEVFVAEIKVKEIDLAVIVAIYQRNVAQYDDLGNRYTSPTVTIELVSDVHAITPAFQLPQSRNHNALWALVNYGSIRVGEVLAAYLAAD